MRTLGPALVLALFTSPSFNLHAAPVTVALDLSRLDEAAYHQLDGLSLERRAVLRLVQEGFAVVAQHAGPLITIQLGVADQRVVLKGRTGAIEEERQVSLLPERETAELHLELAQKIAELARGLIGRTPALAATPPAPAPENSVPWSLRFGLGGLARGSIDPELHAAILVGAPFFVDLEGGLAGHLASGVDTLDGTLSVGGGMRLLLGEVFRISAGLTVGALIHAFHLENVALDPDGLRVDFLARMPIRLELDGPSGLTGGVLVMPGLASRSREHLGPSGSPIWRRDALSFLAGLELGWRFQ